MVKMEAIENIVCRETGHCGCHLLALGSELLSPSGEAGGLSHHMGPSVTVKRERVEEMHPQQLLPGMHLLPHTAPTHPHSRSDPGVRNFPYQIQMRWLIARDKCEVTR